jgi:hypothetical protein
MIFHIVSEGLDFLLGGIVNIVAAIKGGNGGGRRRGDADDFRIGQITSSRHQTKKENDDQGKDKAAATKAAQTGLLRRRGRGSG